MNRSEQFNIEIDFKKSPLIVNVNSYPVDGPTDHHLVFDVTVDGKKFIIYMGPDSLWKMESGEADPDLVGAIGKGIENYYA